jgi:hypothetical protein
MRTAGRLLVLSIISATLVACSGGNGKSKQVQQINPPAAPVVTVDADIKQLIFGWDAVAGAMHYRLLENPDGHSGFVQVGDDIPSSEQSVSREIAVHLHDWVNALYLIQACNTGGCADSEQVSATDVMLDTIGYFKASDSGVGDSFGRHVRLSADGKTLAVSAYKTNTATGSTGIFDRSGGIYVFQNDGTNWNQQEYIKPPVWEQDDLSSVSSVEVSADGATLAIGDIGETYGGDEYTYAIGAVHIMRLEDSGWSPQAWLAPWGGSGSRFGESVALSSDGKTLAVGSPGDWNCATGVHPEPPIRPCAVKDIGAVYVLRFDESDWKLEAFIKGNSSSMIFGDKVALSDDGNLLAVDAPGEHRVTSGGYANGSVHVFRFDGSQWVESTMFAPVDETKELEFELSALSADGTTLATRLCSRADWRSDPWDCESQLLRFDGSDWVERAAFPNIQVCALSEDGNVLVVCSNDDSNAIGINGDRNNDMAESSGAVDILEFDGLEWSQISYVKASNTDAEDHFGFSAALSADGKTLVVGAYGEDSSATGINGDQADNSAEDSGAVYIH